MNAEDHAMLPLDILFGLSLIYGGGVLTLIAILMTTATNKTPTETAFTIREWFFACLFGSVGFLLLVNLTGEVVYTTGIILASDVVMTLIVIALIRAHIHWRDHHGADIDVPRDRHPLGGPAGTVDSTGVQGAGEGEGIEQH
jgi:hypothetical protein